MTWAIHQGDALEVLRTLPDQSVHCCVTSPPYFHLRDYGCAGQIGDEPTIAEYLDRLVAVFGEVRRAERAFNRRRRVMPEPRQNPSFSAAVSELVTMRNPRTVWTIPTQARSDNHYASFPDELARRCILSGCPVGGTVLDPFVGRGTTIIVALRNQRHGIGIDLSPEYCEMSRRNIIDDAPLFNTMEEAQNA